MALSSTTESRVDVQPSVGTAEQSILTKDALSFLADLVARFAGTVDSLLARRVERQARFDAGAAPVFLDETASVRKANWQVAPIPADLLDRRVEITGPVDRKMIINALNSGANVFMADFEDSNSPTWSNVIQGQINLRDAVNRTIRYVDQSSGKAYALNPRVATLMVRPRGWHLREKHLLMAGRAVPAALVDFGLFFFHNARALIERGSGPYFYLPKIQSHLEARLWNDVFCFAQDALGIPRGTIRATVLIETLPAAFEMDEILWQLRDHSAGLNCGRWDYIFSFIKTFRQHAKFLLPDREQVTMTQPFMRAYTRLLIKTCHRRGIHAMGGMAAQIPIKSDPAQNDLALRSVRADKLREVADGHDGTWVAHPGLVSIAKAIFDTHMLGPNQIGRNRDDANVDAADLLRVPTGTRTQEGLRHNVRVAVQYLESWLKGNGCVPLYNLMEDAATAEISRTQIWQWLRHGAILDDGRAMDHALFDSVLEQEVTKLAATRAADDVNLRQARDLFERLITSSTCADFLTLPAYDVLSDNN